MVKGQSPKLQDKKYNRKSPVWFQVIVISDEVYAKAVTKRPSSRRRWEPRAVFSFLIFTQINNPGGRQKARID